MLGAICQLPLPSFTFLYLPTPTSGQCLSGSFALLTHVIKSLAAEGRRTAQSAVSKRPDDPSPRPCIPCGLIPAWDESTLVTLMDGEIPVFIAGG